MPVHETHPQPRARKTKAHELVTKGTPKHPAFPARWCDGLYVLPGVPGLLATVVCGFVIRKRDPSVGRSGPHDFAARLGRARIALPKASIASRAQRP
jgi:hypothetical protein